MEKLKREEEEEDMLREQEIGEIKTRINAYRSRVTDRIERRRIQKDI
jgi:hypothetical protein